MNKSKHIRHKEEKPREGVVSVFRFSQKLNVSAAVLGAWLKSHPELVGEVKRFRFGPAEGMGLTPEQRRIVSDNMERPADAPKGVLSIFGFANELNVSKRTLDAWIGSHPELIGEVKRFRFRAKSAPGLTPKQQRCVRAHMKRFAAAPEGVISVARFAAELKVAPQTLRVWLRPRSAVVGKVQSFRFGSRIGVGLTPAQRQIVRERMERPDPAPEGALSVDRFAKSLGISPPTLHKWLESHADFVGGVNKYKFDRCFKYARGLTLKQQQIVRGRFGHLSDTPKVAAPFAAEHTKRPAHTPAGVISVARLAEELGVTSITMHAWLKTHADSIGELKKYRFRSVKGLGLTLRQRQIARKRFKRLEDAPADVVSVFRFSQKLNVSAGTLAAWLKSHPELVGEVKRFRFRSKNAAGLTPKQRQIVQRHMECQESAPADVVSVPRFAAELNVAVKTLHTWLKTHADIVGEVKKYRFVAVAGLGLTAEQRQTVQKHMERCPNAPRGVISLHKFCKLINTDIRTLRPWLAAHASLVGDIQTFRFGKINGLGLTPRQQSVIKKGLRKTRIAKRIVIW